MPQIRIQNVFFVSLLFCLLSCDNLPEQKTSSNTSDVPEVLIQQIIGGTPASSREFPFLVNIWMNTPQDNYVSHHCGASLIAERWLLTAAHCLLEDVTESNQGVVKAESLIIYLGSDHISGKGGRILKVKSIVIHPEFSWPNHDIALIEIATPVSDVKPVELASTDYSEQTPDAKAVVMGWGLIDELGKKDPETLQMVQVPLINRNLCNQDPFPKSRGWKINESMLCAESSYNKKASCPGDSGGPLVYFSGDKMIQIGVVSWGSACRPQRNQKPSNVEVYSSVSDALPWIRSVINF